MKEYLKRGLSLVLALIMLFGMVPELHVHATDELAPPVALEEETAAEVPAEAPAEAASVLAPVEVEQEAELPEAVAEPEGSGEELLDEVVASGTCGAALSWELFDDGNLAISGSGAMDDYAAASKTPWYEYLADIQFIYIAAELTSVGDYAFAEMSNLERVHFDWDAPKFGANSFSGTTTLVLYSKVNGTWTEDIMQDYGGDLSWGPYTYVEEIGSCGDNLSWEIHNDGTLHITGTGDMYDYASEDDVPWAEWKERIICVYVEYDVTSIGTNAFSGCTNLTEISFWCDAPAIGENAFYGVEATVYYSANDSWTEDVMQSYGGTLTWVSNDIYFPPESLASGECGENLSWYLYEYGGLEIIGSGAMYTYSAADQVPWHEWRDSIESVFVNDGVTSISDYAFANCYRLTTVDFAGNAPTIGKNAFYKVACWAYYNEDDASWTESVMQNYGGTLIWCPVNYDVGDPVATGTFGEDLMWQLEEDGCLRFVMLSYDSEDAVAVAPAYTAPEDVPWHKYRDMIRGVYFHADLTAVSDYAFSDCPNLEEVYFYNDAPAFGEHAFDNTTTAVYYPEDNDTWDDVVGKNYGGTLTWISCEAGVADGDCGEMVYWYLETDGVLHITGTGDMYSYTDVASVPWHAWRDEIKAVVIRNGITSISDYAFADCKNLTDVSFFGYEEAWKLITIGSNNDSLCNARLHYPCEMFDWDDGVVTTEPGCETKGVKTYTCSCGVTKTEEIAALGHDYKATVTAPTCTEKGYTTHTCSRCKDSYADTYVDATGHSWDAGVVTKEPTTTTKGVKTYTCSKCSETKTEEIPVLESTIAVPAKPYKVTNVVSGVHVYWKAVDGASKYGLWRSETGKDGTYKWLANPTVTHFTDITVESGKTYYYKVTAMDSATGKHSDKSEAIGITYVATPNITLRVNRAAGIGLGWNAVKGATGYAIYRKSYSGTDAWVRVATISGANTLSWVDTSVKNENGTVYRYTIRALAGSNMKTLSGCRNTGRTMVRLPSRTLSSATKVSNNAVKCTWTTTSQATGYEVRFMVGSTVYKTFDISSYKTGVKTFTGLASGKNYKIQVRSYKNVAGVGKFYSAWSTAKEVTLG